MNLKLCITTFVLLFLINISFAQDINSAKLDSFFNILHSKDKAMGSIAISKNGKLLYNKTIGYSYINGDEKMNATNATEYRIGSISKMFTAVMIFQLIEEGKISLETKLDKYFPKVANAKKISIADMLYHRSGIHSITDDSNYLKWNTIPKTHEELLKLQYKYASDFAPDSITRYSNSNYLLLGFIIERFTKQTFAQALKSRITSRLKLNNTYYGSKINLKNNECYSYLRNNTWQQDVETDMSVPGGAGAIVSTTANLVQFIEGLFSNKLIKNSSLEKMKTIKDGMGMGMFQVPFGKKKGYGHNGGIDAFHSVLYYFPEDSMAISYCTNGVNYPMNDILIGSLAIYFNKPYKIPTFEVKAIDNADLIKYAGVYSSKDFPLKLTITTNGNTLSAQATGQSSFELEAVGKNEFKFDPAGIHLIFDAENEITLKQSGLSFKFIKEK